MTVPQIIASVLLVLLGLSFVIPLFISIGVATWTTAIKEIRKLYEDKKMP